MRKSVLRKLLPGLVLMCGLLCAGLTSCVSDDGDWNYLYFNGNGRGYYYYLQGGREYTERTVYYSQDSNTGTSRYQINIQYEYSSPVTMNYWFTHGGDTMWMQWRTGNGAVQTYVYDRMNRAPW